MDTKGYSTRIRIQRNELRSRIDHILFVRMQFFLKFGKADSYLQTWHSTDTGSGKLEVLVTKAHSDRIRPC